MNIFWEKWWIDYPSAWECCQHIDFSYPSTELSFDQKNDFIQDNPHFLTIACSVLSMWDLKYEPLSQHGNILKYPVVSLKDSAELTLQFNFLSISAPNQLLIFKNSQ